MNRIVVTSVLCALAVIPLTAPISNACEVNGIELSQHTQSGLTVSLETALGPIEITVDLQRAPRTACNFLKYVANGGSFRRTVRPDNQLSARMPIAVIQAYPNPKQYPDAFGPVPLERTRDTGLRHCDGTVSMARGRPDDATSEFFICVGDQPELDFGGGRNPDGQGFAAFGKVIRGMEIVRRVHTSHAKRETLIPPIPILFAHIVDPR